MLKEARAANKLTRGSDDAPLVWKALTRRLNQVVWHADEENAVEKYEYIIQHALEVSEKKLVTGEMMAIGGEDSKEKGADGDGAVAGDDAAAPDADADEQRLLGAEGETNEAKDAAFKSAGPSDSVKADGAPAEQAESDRQVGSYWKMASAWVDCIETASHVPADAV